MAVNEARALRVVEIINDFRTLQIHIPQLKSEPPGGAEREEGYIVMSQCIAEAQQLLAAQFSPESAQHLSGNGEGEKIQLQRYVLLADIAAFWYFL